MGVRVGLANFLSVMGVRVGVALWALEWVWQIFGRLSGRGKLGRLEWAWQRLWAVCGR